MIDQVDLFVFLFLLYLFMQSKSSRLKKHINIKLLTKVHFFLPICFCFEGVLVFVITKTKMGLSFHNTQ